MQKPILLGLGSMGNTGSNGGQIHPGWIPDNSLTNIANVNAQSLDLQLIRWVVINFTWAQIQPNSSSDFVTTAIDNALADIAAYNVLNPAAPLKASLRMWAGWNTPTWANTLYGTVTVNDRNGHPIQTTPYWTPGVLAAIGKVVDMLGDQYDSNPLVARFSSPFSISTDDEPLVECDEDSVSILIGAGRTDMAKFASLTYAASAFSHWPTTPIEFTLNVFSNMNSGKVKNDSSHTISYMQAVRTQLGAQRAILSQHDLQDPPSSNPFLAQIYDQIRFMGPTINFQFGQASNTTPSLVRGVAIGMSAVEVWDGINGHSFANPDFIPLTDLITWAKILSTPSVPYHWHWATTT